MKLATRWLAIALLLAFCTGQTAWSAKPSKTAPAALLGSPAFQPTPEHPLGWRGDGTGRYLGARPPQEWFRRVASGAVAKASNQSRKPKNEDEAGDAAPMELGIIKDWLVLGPFPSETPEEDIEKSQIPNEADVQPDENDTAGGLKWKALHSSIDTQSTHYTNEGTCQDYNVDFVFLYGQINNQVAYAHTYIYSPEGGPAQLSLHRAGAAGKFWLNGQPTVLNPKDWADIHKSNVTLKKGWNRLLVKLSCGRSTRPEGQNAWISKWRFSVYFSAPLPATYETKNIAWMTKLSGFSASSPVVVGDRIFLTCATSDLMCLNKQDGHIEWLTTCTPCDAMTDAEKKEADVDPLLAELDKANENLVPVLNGLNSLAGLPKDQQERADALIKQKHELEKKLHDALRAVDRKKYPPLYENEVSGANGTPATDGQRVYIAVGGGSKGPGAYVIAAYTLDGKRIWSYHEALGAGEHGNHISPLLIDGKLIFAATWKLLAFDAKSGQIAWRAELPRDAENCTACSFVPAKIAGVSVLVAYPSRIIRVADGQLLGEFKNQTFFHGESTPIVENGLIYFCGDTFRKEFRVVKLPQAPNGNFQDGWKLVDDQWRIAESSGFSIASPLAVRGMMVYSVDTMGGLSLIDAAGEKLIYKRRLEMYQRANRQIWGFTASPTLAGNSVFIFDNTGSAVVLEPTAKYKELAKNIIENQTASDWQDYKQESFYASPVFDDASLYLKGSEFLYCIREK